MIFVRQVSDLKGGISPGGQGLTSEQHCLVPGKPRYEYLFPRESGFCLAVHCLGVLSLCDDFFADNGKPDAHRDGALDVEERLGAAVFWDGYSSVPYISLYYSPYEYLILWWCG